MRLLLPDSATTLTALRTTWQTRGHLRLTPPLPEAFAVACLRVLRATTHTATQHVDPESGHQLWRYAWEPGTDCSDHPLCDLGHTLTNTLTAPATARALFDRDLLPSPSPMISTQLRKSCFADPWAELDPAHSIAFALHLTTAPWPAHWGGHLERITDAHAHFDSHAPTWNALDLFDLAAPHQAPTWRRLPLITEHVEGYLITGTLNRVAD